MDLNDHQEIQAVLDKVVKSRTDDDADTPRWKWLSPQPRYWTEGLHFAIFLPRGADGTAQISDENLYSENLPAVERMLQIHGLMHAARVQVALWRKPIRAVLKSFTVLEKAAQSKLNKTSLQATRLVLDTEIGGILSAAVEEHGWVFGATLNQQAMNAGWAEQDLVEITSALAPILRRT